MLKDKLNEYDTSYDRLFAPIEFAKEWNLKRDCRGCPFLIIASEVTGRDTNIRKEVIYHWNGFREILRELLEDLKNSDDK